MDLKKKEGSISWTLIIVLGVIGLAAVVYWIYEAIAGGTSSSGNLTPWGTYVMAFSFSDGIATGAILIATIPFLMGLERYRNVTRYGTIIGLCFACVAGLSIMGDLGQPFRVLNMIVSGRIASPLMWDMISLVALIVCALLFLIAQTRWSEKANKVLAVICALLAVVVTFVMAAIFTANSTREMWSSALLGPWFVASAVASGAACLLIMLFAMEKAGVLQTDEKVNRELCVTMAIALACDIVLLLFDVFVAGFSGSESEATAVASMLTGSIAPFFWLEVIGAVVAIVLVAMPSLRTQPKMILTAAIVGLVAMLCKRFEVMESGFATTNLALPGVQTGGSGTTMYSIAAGALPFVPSINETFICLGFIVLGVAAVLLIVNLMKAADDKPEAVEAADEEPEAVDDECA